MLYDRAVLTFLEVQGSIRVDLDDGPTRTWAAFGVQGLSVYFFDVETTGYNSDRDRFAARMHTKAIADQGLVEHLRMSDRIVLFLETLPARLRCDARRDYALDDDVNHTGYLPENHHFY